MIRLEDFSKEDMDRLGYCGRQVLIEAVGNKDQQTLENLYQKLHPQTNEEWLRTLPTTEEQAEALARGSCGLAVPYDANEFTIAEIKRRWEKWLKQPHKEE